MLATANVWAENLQLGISQLEQCLRLNPYLAHAQIALGNRLDLTGRTDDGIQQMEQSLELNPRDPTRATYMSYLLRAYASKGDFQSALFWIEQTVSVMPDNPDPRYRQAICLANVNQVAAAQAALAKCEQLQTGLFSAKSSWRPYADEKRNARFFSGLRKHKLVDNAFSR